MELERDITQEKKDEGIRVIADMNGEIQQHMGEYEIIIELYGTTMGRNGMQPINMGMQDDISMYIHRIYIYIYVVGGFKQFFIVHDIWDNPSY